MSTLELIEKVAIRLNREIGYLKNKDGKIKWKIGRVRYTLDTSVGEVMAYNESDVLLLINKVTDKDYWIGGQLENFIIGAEIMDAIDRDGVEAAMKIAR